MFTEDEIRRIPYQRGPYNAKIAIVGEAPGDHEEQDEKKRPFIGPSGQLLEGLLKKTGIDPDEIYFTNRIKEKPDLSELKKKTAKEWLKRNPEKANAYKELLNLELGSLPSLEMVIPAGAIALEIVCNKYSIDNWRGSIIPATLEKIKGKKCIPLIHPAAILRNWLFRPATVVDLQRIKQQAKFPEIRRKERKPNIHPNFEEILTYLDFLKKSDCLISFDLETLPRPQRIVSFQLSHSDTEGIAVLLQHKDGRSCFSEDQELIIMLELRDLLENCGPRLIGQNFLTFDIFMMQVYGMNMEKMLKNVYLDTMEAFACLQPQLPMGLDFLTSVYTEEPYYKSEGKEWGTFHGEEEFLLYGVKDVLVVSEIAPQLMDELVEEKLLDLYKQRYEGLAYARLKMSRRGLRISKEKRKELDIKFTRNIVIEQARFNILTGKNVNVRSSKQMCDLLYKDMKLPPQYNKDGNLTSSEDALLLLASKFPSEMFRHVLNLRGMLTRHSNNIKSSIDSDGRIRCSYGFTETGRFRSFKCPLGSGSNLQNWSPDMRVMVVPDPGMVLLEGDLSQAEARVVAAAGNIKYMLDVFKNDPGTPEGDIHRHMAALIFEMVLEDVTKTGPQRYAAKRIVHAADYDMHAQTFAKRYNKDAADNNMPLISVQTAGQYLSTLHERLPELRNNYHAWIQELIRTTKIVTNPFGRRIVFHDRIGSDLFRAGYAYYPQSTVADVTNTILDGVCRELDVLLQVHDSILIQCRLDEVEDVVQFMLSLNPKFTVGKHELCIPLEFKMSDVSWGNLKDYIPKSNLPIAA